MKQLYISLCCLILISCSNEHDYVASGNFESDEVIVSAQQNGLLESFNIKEGSMLKKDSLVGQIDVTLVKLQKEQTEATIHSLQEKTSNPVEQAKVVKRQLLVQQSQLNQQQRERLRTKNLVEADAATQKQLDDLDAGIDQLQKQIGVTHQQLKLYNSNTSTQNRSILSEKAPLEVGARQYQEQIDKGQVINPINGTVLTTYILKGELAVIGKPLYKIANVDTLYLKAYITGDLLSGIKPGQQVQVRIDQGDKGYKNYSGVISWISDKSEFTPKTIQTKNERANLVYALKVRVKNDGYLKIGMYGEVIAAKDK
ncbi:HlyD family secretion protein [Arcticibacter eurypsychrophilus]|uniref:HlyD family secretion protein n=1 Tax=Arcticibacter eurypsychrophilus TaxID=1434752 RepID=UPI00084D9A22|nr:HlyD family efflux transporter periplasmic adaptor subunit [Arcticibacter eurypsychrophilus]